MREMEEENFRLNKRCELDRVPPAKDNHGSLFTAVMLALLVDYPGFESLFVYISYRLWYCVSGETVPVCYMCTV